MASLKEIVANNIKRLRSNRGWTFSQMAEFTECDISTAQKWESMDRFPRPEQLEKIASAFKISVPTLFEEPGTDRAELPSLNESIKVVCMNLGYEAKPLKKKKMIGTFLGGLQEVDQDHPAPALTSAQEVFLRDLDKRLAIPREGGPHPDLSQVPPEILETLSRIKKRWDLVHEALESLAEPRKEGRKNEAYKKD